MYQERSLMKKNILEPASLLLGCITSLSILNPTYNSVQTLNEQAKTQFDLQYDMEYYTPNITSSGAIAVPNILENVGQDVEIHFAKTMYAKSNVNVRASDNLNSDIVTVLKRGKAVQVFECQSNGWSRVLYKNRIRYIYTKYLSKKKPKEEKLGDYVEYTAPGGHHPKSYMDWDCITSRSSKQYKLKQSSYIGKYGIIMNEGRYCVALGSGFIKNGVGTKFDLVLENGTIIKCVAGDMKADAHTDGSNRITSHDGSIAEFIVNTSSLVNEARRMGDISYSCPEWNSEIAKVRVYQEGRK